MTHQFKQLADVDITTAPVEVGPTRRAKHTGVEGNRQYNPGWHLAKEAKVGA